MDETESVGPTDRTTVDGPFSPRVVAHAGSGPLTHRTLANAFGLDKGSRLHPPD